MEEFARFGFKISAETLRERFKKVDKAQKEERAAKRKPPADASSAATLPAAATSINANE